MEAMSRSVSLALMCAAVVGCGGSQTSSESLYRGSTDEPPSMEVLPQADVPRAELTERMRFALLLAQESFELEEPHPPVNATTANVQQWADGELEAWLEKKNERVEAARAELDAAAEEDHRQRIMAGALVGLMYEDVARVLLQVPVPAELQRSEPEIAKIFREIVRFQAKPYIEHAKRAYYACARNAVRPESMRHWSHFCAARRDGLPSAGDGGGSGDTVVSVSVE